MLVVEAVRENPAHLVNPLSSPISFHLQSPAHSKLSKICSLYGISYILPYISNTKYPFMPNLKQDSGLSSPALFDVLGPPLHPANEIAYDYLKATPNNPKVQVYMCHSTVG